MTEAAPTGFLLGRLSHLLGDLACPKRRPPPDLTINKRDENALDLEQPRQVQQHLALGILNGERIRVREAALADSQCEQLLASIKDCRYFGENTGDNGFFKGTRGFHIKFRNTHRKDVQEHFPFLRPALDAVLRQECNCYYLNVIFTRPDGQEYHVDNYFTGACGTFRPTDFVSVLYLNASEDMEGGELVVLGLEHGGGIPMRGGEGPHILQRVAARRGLCVDFDGRLLHAVNAFKLVEGAQPRVTLVVEQCKLPRRVFLKTPKCTVYCQNTNQDIDLSQ